MIVALDTETALATNDEPVPPLVSAAFCAGESTLHHRTDPDLPALLRGAWSGSVVLANAPFDATVCLRYVPALFPVIVQAYHEGRVIDILTREKLIDIALGQRNEKGRLYNLGAVAERRAGYPVDKADPWRRRYVELIDTPVAAWPEGARHYAIEDVRATWAVYQAQEAFRAELLDATGLDVFADAVRQARKHWALYAQTLHGVHTDQTAVDALAARLDNEINRDAHTLLACGLARWQGKARPKLVANTKVAQERLREHVAATPGAVLTPTATGVSLDHLSMLAAKVPPDSPLGVFARRKAACSLRTQKLPILRRPLIRTRYEECVDTGRTSSSGPQSKRKPADVAPWEWIGTNIQNLPVKGGWRECLVPPPGHVFVITDWSGAELVTFAQVQVDMFGRSKLADAIREGKDAHGMLAAQLLGIPFERFNKKTLAGADARDIAKRANFGFLGGMGPSRFADTSSVRGRPMSVDEARHVKDVWLRTWETQAYFDHWAAQQKRSPDGKITLVQPRSGRLRGGCSFSEACNSPFQGLAGDAAGETLWRLWLAQHDPDSGLFGCYQAMFVHDEPVTVAPAERAEAAREAQERIMIDTFAAWCPDVPIGVESKIVDRYCK